MMAHNLCYTTLVDKTSIDRLELEKDVDYVQTPNGGQFFLTLSERCLTLHLFRFLCYQVSAERVTAYNS